MFLTLQGAEDSDASASRWMRRSGRVVGVLPRAQDSRMPSSEMEVCERGVGLRRRGIEQGSFSGDALGCDVMVWDLGRMRRPAPECLIY